MLGGEHGEFHARTQGGIRPLVAIQLGGIHQCGAQIIGGPGNAVLALAWRRVVGMKVVGRVQIGCRTEVNEHAEAQIHQVTLQVGE